MRRACMKIRRLKHTQFVSAHSANEQATIVKRIRTKFKQLPHGFRAVLEQPGMWRLLEPIYAAIIEPPRRAG